MTDFYPEFPKPSEMTQDAWAALDQLTFEIIAKTRVDRECLDLPIPEAGAKIISAVQNAYIGQPDESVEQ